MLSDGKESVATDNSEDTSKGDKLRSGERVSSVNNVAIWNEVAQVENDAIADMPPTVLSAVALSNSFLGKIVEVCIVTEDHVRTMAGLVRLGIGPFRVYTFDDSTLTAPKYRGTDSPFSLKVYFATNNNLTWEIMQPLNGRSIMREFLEEHGEGIHHIAFDCDGMPWEQRLSTFSERGFKATQSGRWLNRNAFSFFNTEAATTTCFETYHFPDDFVFPEPERWYPSPPPSGTPPTATR